MQIQQIKYKDEDYLLIEVPEDATDFFVKISGMIFWKRNKPPQNIGEKFTYLPKKYTKYKEVVGKLLEIDSTLYNDMLLQGCFENFSIRLERILLCKIINN